MLVAITGTPGTGKTATAECLASKGYKKVSLNDVMSDSGLLSEYDGISESFIINVDSLKNAKIDVDGIAFIEGHLSHHLQCDLIIVLRCNPDIISRRLRERGYSTHKVAENVEAERIDVSLIDAIETGIPTFEIDCSSKSVDAVAASVLQIINGNVDDYRPGNISWLEGFLDGDGQAP